MLSGVTFLWLHYLVETSDVGSLRHFPGSLEGKASTCNAGALGSTPELRRSPGEGNGNPLQYSCLENPMDGGAWETEVLGVTRVGHNLATKPPPTR